MLINCKAIYDYSQVTSYSLPALKFHQPWGWYTRTDPREDPLGSVDIKTRKLNRKTYLNWFLFFWHHSKSISRQPKSDISPVPPGHRLLPDSSSDSRHVALAHMLPGRVHHLLVICSRFQAGRKKKKGQLSTGNASSVCPFSSGKQWLS